MSDRNKFIGGHVTEEVAQALEAEAERRRTSKSKTLYELLKDALRKAGHRIINGDKRD